jgi:hypothetical protein
VRREVAAAVVLLFACATASACLVSIADPSAALPGDGGPPASEAGEASVEASSEASADADATLDSPPSETGAADAPPESAADVQVQDVGQDAPPLTQYIVFATSMPYPGNLGGLSGADHKCQGLAMAAGLSGTFKAWLSDGTTSAASRLTHGTLPYVLLDGTLVANDWADLTSGSVQNMIVRDEGNHLIASTNYSCGTSPTYPGFLVWTDSYADGGVYDPNNSCLSWGSSSSGDYGSGGSASPANQANSYWSDWCHLITCDTQAPLYCVQQ